MTPRTSRDTGLRAVPTGHDNGSSPASDSSSLLEMKCLKDFEKEGGQNPLQGQTCSAELGRTATERSEPHTPKRIHHKIQDPRNGTLAKNVDRANVAKTEIADQVGSTILLRQ